MVKIYKSISFQVIFVCLFLLDMPYLYSQACDPLTPSYQVNLTGQPNGSWVSLSDKRKGLCCTAKSPDVCVEFFITLDPGSQGIKLDIETGAEPPGALFYEVNCANPTPVGSIMCLNGIGPHRVTFCKPGNNPNSYRITSIPAPKASPPIAVSDGCSGIIYSSGYYKPSIKWNSVPYNVTYNSYMSCSVACDTVLVTAQPGYPAFIDYEVSGNVIGGCSNITFRDTVRVFFITDKKAVILPEKPRICFGGTQATLTANGVGGAPPYSYLWSTGATTKSILAGLGTFWVRIRDSTNCPPVFDTVTVVQDTSAITVDAGPAVVSCANNPSVSLSGIVNVATGGRWSGGQGTYSPNDSSLNVTYTPTATEITAGSVVHLLSSTGNGSCPVVMDSAIQSITKSPAADAGASVQMVCADTLGLKLNGTFNNAGGILWSTLGSGNFGGNEASLSPVYKFSAGDTVAGSVDLVITTINNGTCFSVADTITITINPAPKSFAGSDKKVCANNSITSLKGSVMHASGGVWITQGSGSFSSGASDLNTSYIPSNNDTSSGLVKLILMTTGNGLCKAAYDTMRLTITKDLAVMINAGLDQTVCANKPNVPLFGTVPTTGIWNDDGSGYFSPNDSTMNAVYIPSAADTIKGSLQIFLTSTNNGLCAAKSDTMLLTINPGIYVNAGADQVVCGNNKNVQLSGKVQGVPGGIWSTGGSGLFTPDKNTLNAMYVPDNADTARGNVTLVLSSAGSGACEVVTDTLKVIITNAPVSSAGLDLTVCGNNATVTLAGKVANVNGGKWITKGDGGFTPHDSTLNVTYYPGSADTAAGKVLLILTTTGNGSCYSVSDTSVVSITDAPSVFAGSDQVVCADIPGIGLSGKVSIATGITWSRAGGGGFFTPNPNVLNPTYIPDNADKTKGNVTLVATSTGNGTCSIVTDTLKITMTAAPTINAGSNMIVCANNASVVLNGAITISTGGKWTTSGTGVFLPNDSALNATYLPTNTDTATGSVLLFLQTTGNGTCVSLKDTLKVTITDAPVVLAGSDQSVCANNAVTTLNGSVTMAAGGTWSGGSGTYSPDSNSLNISYTPSPSEITGGQAVLLFTSSNYANCKQVTDTSVITITKDAISVNAGTDTTICSTKFSLMGMVSVAKGGQWSTLGTGSFSPGDSLLNAIYNFSKEDTTTGQVKLVLTTTGNGGCAVKRDTVLISILDQIIVNASAEDTVCANAGPVAVSVNVSTAQGKWSTAGSGTFTPNATSLNAFYNLSAADIASGKLMLIFTSLNNGPCAPVTDTVKVVVLSPPIADFTSQDVCLNKVTSFLDSTKTAGAIVSWKWSFGNAASGISQNPSHTYNASGTYNVQLIATAADGCRDTVLKPVTVFPLPATDFSNTAKCFVDSVYFKDITTLSTGSINNWTWDLGNGQTSALKNPAGFYSPGTYTVSLVSGSVAGCTATMTKTISVQPSPKANFTNTSVCLNNATLFTDSSTLSTGSIVTWNWDFNDGKKSTLLNPAHSFLSAGIYDVQLIVISATGCSDTVVKKVIVSPLPESKFTTDGQCLIDGTNFTDISTVVTGSVNSWQWYFGDGGKAAIQNPVHKYSVVGNYPVSLIVKTDKGCIDTLTQLLQLNPSPTAGFIADKSTVILQKPVILTDQSKGAVSWLWDFGDSNGSSFQSSPGYTYLKGGTYTISQVVTNTLGCTDTFLLKIVVTQPPGIPNGFSPNNDGQNDVLFVKGGPYKNLDFRIYNNWGELIFITRNEAVGWDGTRNGVAQPMDVYVYTMTGITEDNVKHELHGDVTLLR